MPATAVEDDLRAIVEATTSRLLALTDEEAARPPAPDKWSPKQIIGHLIDSATNNHQRFVRARFTDDLVFQGYDQEGWVEAQRYETASWSDLVAFWRLYNLHLARVMESTPQPVKQQMRTRHNLHELARKTFTPDQSPTLDFLMRDYVGHLENHLRQILG